MSYRRDTDGSCASPKNMSRINPRGFKKSCADDEEGEDGDDANNQDEDEKQRSEEATEMALDRMLSYWTAVCNAENPPPGMTNPLTSAKARDSPQCHPPSLRDSVVIHRTSNATEGTHHVRRLHGASYSDRKRSHAASYRHNEPFTNNEETCQTDVNNNADQEDVEEQRKEEETELALDRILRYWTEVCNVEEIPLDKTNLSYWSNLCNAEDTSSGNSNPMTSTPVRTYQVPRISMDNTLSPIQDISIRDPYHLSYDTRFCEETTYGESEIFKSADIFEAFESTYEYPSAVIDSSQPRLPYFIQTYKPGKPEGRGGISLYQHQPRREFNAPYYDQTLPFREERRPVISFGFLDTLPQPK